MCHNNNVELVYEWSEVKRQKILATRKLDMVILAPKVFADPNVMIEQDNRHNYGEERFLAYALVEGTRICLCFTPRNGKIHLITVFKMHKKAWEAHYEKAD